jgi:hypothetical protein
MKIQNHKEMLSADIQTSAKHRWKEVVLTDAEKHGRPYYNEKKFVCIYCGCEKHQSQTYVYGKPNVHLTYWRSGIHFDLAPECWGAKSPK